MESTNLENARATESDSQRRLEQLSLLLDVGKSIVSHLNLRELIDVISDSLRQVIHCDGIWMTLYEADSGQLRVFALDSVFKSTTPADEGQLVSMEGTPSEWVMKSLQTILVTRAMLENSPSPAARQVAATGMQSGCVAPLISRGRAIGTIAMVSKRENAFTQEDADLFTQIAGQIAIAVDNARNFERAREAEQELSRKVNHLGLMLKITNAVVSQLELEELIEVISSSISEVIGNTSSGVLLFDEESGQLRAFMTNFPAGHPLAEKGFPVSLEGGPSGMAFTTGQPIFVDKPDVKRFYSELSKRVFEEGYQSGATIPLIAQGRKLGVLGISSKHQHAFTNDDQELLTQVANQVAIAVDNAINYKRARVAEEEAKRQSERLQLMLDVNNSVTTNLDLRELFKAISACLRQVIRYDGAGLALYDDESKQSRVYALDTGIVGQVPVEEGTLVSIADSPGEVVFATRQTTIFSVEDLRKMASPMVQRIVADGIKTSCLAPLISHGQVFGGLSVVSYRENAFTKEEAELLTVIAGQIAIAVENALNFEKARVAEEEAKRQSKRRQLLLEINNAVVSNLNLPELFAAISTNLRGVLHCDFAGLALYDPQLDQLRVQALDYARNQEIFGATDLIPLTGTGAGKAFTSRLPVIVRHFKPAESSIEMVRIIVAAGFKSSCHVPLISHDRALGTLDVLSFRDDAFSEEDAELLTQIGNQIAIAVENALNFESARAAEQQVARERDRQQLLLEVNNAVVSHLSIPELLQAISACLRRVIAHDFAAMMFYDPDHRVLRPQALDFPEYQRIIDPNAFMPLEGTAPGLAVTSRQPVVVNRLDLTQFPGEAMKRAGEQGLKSGCSVPLISHDQVLGTLDVASFREDVFTEDAVELLNQIGSQIAIAVENALNFERARQAEQEVRRQFERERLMLEINNAVVSELSLRELVRVIASCLREVLRHEIVGLSLYDAETNQLRAYAYDFPDKQFAIPEGTPVPLKGSAGGLAFTSAKPVFFNRIEPEQAVSTFTRQLYNIGVKSGGCVPLIVQGRKLGILGVASFREDAFPEEHQELLNQVASQIAFAVDNALAYREIEALKNKLAEEKLYLEEEIKTAYSFEEIIGTSPALTRILKQVATVAPTDSTVLIRGETGTGKELIARAIHNLSARHERTLVKLNCAAIPTGLLESELFGHERGAFTGAIAQRIGRFELANKGTLFLDEVGDIPLELQPKLLRVLQEQEFERLGSTRTQRVDVRVVAATNSNLEQMVADKQFRGDLFYRFNVFPITLPPLRERREDVPLLVRFFAQKFASRMRKRIEAVPARSLEALTQYHWPGNIRELENLIERAVILSAGDELEVPLSELKPSAEFGVQSSEFGVGGSELGIQATPITTLEEAERQHILRALEETNWVVSGPQGAAARLGMKRTTLQARMQKLGISRRDSIKN